MICHLNHKDILGHVAIVLIHADTDDATLPLLLMIKSKEGAGDL
jgi:hypothetical protein